MLRLRNLTDCCGWGGWGGDGEVLKLPAVECPTCIGLV